MTAIHALQLEGTVEASHVNHRLMLGVQWIDALAQLPVGGNLVSNLEMIGSRTCPLRFDLHPQSRHAVRYTRYLARLLALAAKNKTDAEAALSPLPLPVADDPTNFVLHTYLRRDVRNTNYSIDNDPRHYVPRRLSLTPVQTGGIPPASVDNIRKAWLWPGTAYPLGANTTAIRGRIRKGSALASAKTIPWARVIVTLPANLAAPADFASEPKVGWGHGDDRGEFLIVLGAQAIPGGAVLPSNVTLRIWVSFLPSAQIDQSDPLGSLPLELAGADALNDVLRGKEIPATYLQQDPVTVTIKPGKVFVVTDTDLLFS